MEEICQELHDILFMKFNKHFKVEYAEIPGFGDSNYFFIHRKKYSGYYRLGMYALTAIDFARSLEKIPSDLIEEK